MILLHDSDLFKDINYKNSIFWIYWGMFDPKMCFALIIINAKSLRIACMEVLGYFGINCWFYCRETKFYLKFWWNFFKSFAPKEAEVRCSDRQKNVFWLCRNTCVGAYAWNECLCYAFWKVERFAITSFLLDTYSLRTLLADCLSDGVKVFWD